MDGLTVATPDSATLDGPWWLTKARPEKAEEYKNPEEIRREGQELLEIQLALPTGGVIFRAKK